MRDEVEEAQKSLIDADLNGLVERQANVWRRADDDNELREIGLRVNLASVRPRDLELAGDTVWNRDPGISHRVFSGTKNDRPAARIIR